MEVVTPEFVKDKKVLLRYDLDVLENGVINDPFRLKAGLPTLNLCLENASQVIMMGHIGRPNGQEISELSVASIYQWLADHGFKDSLNRQKLKLLENLRFEEGEESCSLDYATELSKLGDVFVNEAFASYHKAASVSVLPTLLPHKAGLNFAKEVKILGEVKDNPKKPLVVIMGGAKVQDKLSVVQVMAKVSDKVLVGGKLVAEIKDLGIRVPENTLLGELTTDGLDITPQTVEAWKSTIMNAEEIVWNGPMGKPDQGTKLLAKFLLESHARIIVGGGDTVGFLGRTGLLNQFLGKGFVSSGGGAMLKFLSSGTLPSIEALR